MAIKGGVRYVEYTHCWLGKDYENSMKAIRFSGIGRYASSWRVNLNPDETITSVIDREIRKKLGFEGAVPENPDEMSGKIILHKATYDFVLGRYFVEE